MTLSDTEKRPLAVGKSVPRMDGFAKATGRERYAADYYGDDLLWAGVRRAGVPHGVLKAVHCNEARQLHGILAVLTHRDVRGTNRQGVARKDQPVLVDDHIRHGGDAVALVVAENREILETALRLIRIDYDPLPVVDNVETALEDGAVKIHPDNPTGNILLQGSLSTGKGKDAFEDCPVVVEARFRVPRQEHACLETPCGWAILKESGVLEMVVSTQTPFRDRSEVAEALGLPVSKVRVTAPYCGGAFGGKDGVTVQSLLGMAAISCPGRPVKMWWSREESILAGPKRHPAHLHYCLGLKKDGTLEALAVKVTYDTGPYDHLGGVVMTLGLEHAAGPYRIPHTDIRALSVYTNNPVGGAFRGFGVPQVTAALEQVVDMAAEKLGMNPLELRRLNVLHRGEKNALGVHLTGSTGMDECLETLSRHPLWTARKAWKAKQRIFKRRGVGIAGLVHAMGYGPLVPDVANAKIELTTKGLFRIFCGVVDMGQGNATAYAQIAGDILNQEMTRFEIVLPDTARTLPSGSASASRTVYTFGNALAEAAGLLRDRILARVADSLMAQDPHEMALLPGRIVHRPSGREMPLDRAAALLSHHERMALARFRAPVAVERPSSDSALQWHGLPHTLFSHGAHLAAVEVDELTGAVEVQAYVAVTEAGRVLNPCGLEQQIQGGVAQGMGYALLEELQTEKGCIVNNTLSTYIIPSALDIPDMETINLSLHESTGPFGMKGAGEIPMNGPLPAIANALFDACHVRIAQFPMTAERVLKAMEGGNS